MTTGVIWGIQFSLGSNQQAVYSLIFQDFSLPGLVFIVLRDEIASAHTERVTLEEEQLNQVPCQSHLSYP